MNRRQLLAGAAAFGLARSAKASLRIDEIRIGQTMPYSGPASAYGVIGRTEAAYFKAINEQGGVNGRRINLISLDDAYSPPKTVEQTRRLDRAGAGRLYLFNQSRHSVLRFGDARIS